MRTKSDYEKKDEKRVAFGGASSSLEKKRAPKENTHTHASFSLFVRRAIRYRAHEESSADETILYDVESPATAALSRRRREKMPKLNLSLSLSLSLLVETDRA